MHDTESIASVGAAGKEPGEPDQHWAKELEQRCIEAEKATAYHRMELERAQRMGRAAHAALSQLKDRDRDSAPEDSPSQWDRR